MCLFTSLDRRQDVDDDSPWMMAVAAGVCQSVDCGGRGGIQCMSCRQWWWSLDPRIGGLSISDEVAWQQQQHEQWSSSSVDVRRVVSSAAVPRRPLVTTRIIYFKDFIRFESERRAGPASWQQ